MRIAKRLHLVVPIFDDSGKRVVAHVHSTPLSVEMVDRHFMLLAKVHSAIYSQGLGVASGPGMAARLLRKVATDAGTWEDSTPDAADGGRALLEEIRRLTNVLVQREGGWQPLPISVAVDQGFMDPEDQAEVENAIVFFIAESAILTRLVRREMLEQAAELWGARILSLTTTEFMNSLQTSTPRAGSPAKPPAPATEQDESATALVDGKPSSLPR